jgi:DUF4097 and DUF4098 domain-containing protein YvlB
MKTLALAAALLVLTSPAVAQRPIDQRLATPPTGEVEIVNTAGRVNVVAWDRNEIQVTGTLWEGAERLEVTPEGNRTVIRVVLPRDLRQVRGSELEVRVPAGKDLLVRTVSADSEVSGVTGRVEARAVSGSVRVSGAPREVLAQSTSGTVDVEARNASTLQAETVSGGVRLRGAARESIRAETVSGSLEIAASAPAISAKTVSGNVAIGAAQRRVDASTVSGRVRVAGPRLEQASIESVSGSIRVEAALAPRGSFTLTSHSGSVEVALAGTPNAVVEVNTFSGSVQNEFGPDAERTSRYAPGRQLRFTAGSGDGRIVIRTFSGEVKLGRP